MRIQTLFGRRLPTLTRASAILALVAGALFPQPAEADPIDITITSGSTFLYYDGDLSSFSIAGDGFSMAGDHHGGSGPGWPVGSTATLTGGFAPLAPSGDPDRLSRVVIDNVAYDAFLVGTIVMTTGSFIVPSIPSSEEQLFSLPFLASGRIQGYAVPFDTSSTLLFDINLRGQGTASTSGHTSADGSFVVIPGITYVFAEGGEVSPVPEPGSMLLLATGLAGMAGMRKRIYRTICGQFTTSVKPVDAASSRNVLNRKR